MLLLSGSDVGCFVGRIQAESRKNFINDCSVVWEKVLRQGASLFVKNTNKGTGSEAWCKFVGEEHQQRHRVCSRLEFDFC